MDPIAPCVYADIGPLRRPCGVERPYVSKATLKEAKSKATHRILQIFATDPNVLVYLPEKYLCQPDKCLAFLNGEFLYRDGSHIRRNLSAATMDAVINLLQLDRLFDTETFGVPPAPIRVNAASYAIP